MISSLSQWVAWEENHHSLKHLTTTQAKPTLITQVLLEAPEEETETTQIDQALKWSVNNMEEAKVEIKIKAFNKTTWMKTNSGIKVLRKINELKQNEI